MKSTTAIFWKSFVKHPRYTGAIAPSSKSLAQGMLSRTDLRTARLVVELGPGTGAFTTFILAALPPEAELLAIERNPELADFLRRRVPRAHVVCDDAANLARYLINRPYPPAAIFCGLPLSWLPACERTEILDAVAAALAPGNTFTLFQYVHTAPTPPGQRVRRALQARFRHVERFPIWWNLPPAYVVHCIK
jgi:phospholipid N-methyltransferase